LVVIEGEIVKDVSVTVIDGPNDCEKKLKKLEEGF